MKRLILIGGTMGVGKTATSSLLKYQLDNCVFLDGIGVGICILLLLMKKQKQW